MPKIDPLAHRVARRHIARVQAERVAREVQRRPGVLVTVNDDEEKEEKDGDAGGQTGAGRTSSSSPGLAARPHFTRR